MKKLYHKIKGSFQDGGISNGEYYHSTGSSIIFWGLIILFGIITIYFATRK